MLDRPHGISVMPCHVPKTSAQTFAFHICSQSATRTVTPRYSLTATLTAPHHIRTTRLYQVPREKHAIGDFLDHFPSVARKLQTSPSGLIGPRVSHLNFRTSWQKFMKLGTNIIMPLADIPTCNSQSTTDSNNMLKPEGRGFDSRWCQ